MDLTSRASAKMRRAADTPPVDVEGGLPKSSAKSPRSPPAPVAPSAMGGRAAWFELALYFVPLAFAFKDGIQQMWSISRDYADRMVGVSKGTSGLHPGWIFGLQVDLKDAQWHSFRDSIPTLLVVAIAHVALSRSVRYFASAAARPRAVMCVYALFSMGFLCYVHEACILFVLFFLLLNFIMVKCLPGK